jgi:energy-coupling factor transport system substrate-specific component
MLALIPSAVAFNIVVGSIIRTTKLPIYLDCIGGIVTTLLTGVWPGVIVAVLSQTLTVVMGSPPDIMYYTGSAVAMSVCAYILGSMGGFKTTPRAVASGLVMGIVCAMASFGITAWRGGITSAGSSFVTLFYLREGFSLVPATILSGLTCDPIDKITEALITIWLIRAVPVDLLRRFHGGTLHKNFKVND